MLFSICFLSKQSKLNDTKFFELKLNQKVLLLKRIFQQKKKKRYEENDENIFFFLKNDLIENAPVASKA